MSSRINKIINNGWFILVCNLSSVIGLILTFVINDPICKIVFFSISCVMTFGVATYFIYRIISLKRAKRNIEATQVAKERETFTHIHSYYHELRNFSNSIKKKTNFDSDMCCDKTSLLCDRIEKIFSSILKEQVSVCVKRIKTDSILNANQEDWEIYTLGRSSSTQRERLIYDSQNRTPDKIWENSDFKMIISDDRFKDVNFFCCEDLDSYPDKYLNMYEEKFKNSHDKSPYKSAIIVPIRIPIEYAAPILSRDTESKKHFHAIGFLCIDSEAKFVNEKTDFRYSTFHNCAQLACAIGDSLYSFLECFILKDINETMNVNANKTQTVTE